MFNDTERAIFRLLIDEHLIYLKPGKTKDSLKKNFFFKIPFFLEDHHQIHERYFRN